MAGLPATCESCGVQWMQPGIFGGTGQVTMVGTMVGPCPMCGGFGRIQDGAYDLVDGAVRAFRRVNAQTLTHVRDVLRQAEVDDITPAEAAERIVVSAPELEVLLREMQRRQGSWNDPKWWVLALLTLLQIVLPLLQNHDGHLSPQDEQVIERAARHAVEQQPSVLPHPPAVSPAESMRPGTSSQKTNPQLRKKSSGKKYGQTKKRKRR